MDSYSQRFDSTTGRDSKSQKKKGLSHLSTSCYDEGDRKPKFVSIARDKFSLYLIFPTYVSTPVSA